MSRRSVACSRGITSRWPRVAGLMSMNAIVRSSSCTRVDGTSPATILQNRQSGSAAIDRRRVLACGRHAGRHRPPARHRRAPGLLRPPLGLGGRAARRGVDPRRAGRRRASPAVVEEERAVGSMPLPLGLMSAAGVLAGLGGRRTARARAAGGGGHRRRRLRRPARLPARAAAPPTWNVTGTAGDPEAEETLVFVAHHDAANGGLIFRPELTRLIADTFPRWYERQQTSPQMMRLVAAGPALAALGALTGVRPLRQLGLDARGRQRARVLRHRHAHGRAGRQRQPHRGRRPARAGAAAARAARRGRPRAARLHRLGGVVHGGHARLGAPPRAVARPRAHPRRRARDARLAGADPARGRGDDLDDRLRHRGRATSSPRPRSGPASRCGAGSSSASPPTRCRRCGAACRPPRSPPATSTRCPPTTTRSATSRAT